MPSVFATILNFRIRFAWAIATRPQIPNEPTAPIAAALPISLGRVPLIFPARAAYLRIADLIVLLVAKMLSGLVPACGSVPNPLEDRGCRRAEDHEQQQIGEERSHGQIESGLKDQSAVPRNDKHLRHDHRPNCVD